MLLLRSECVNSERPPTSRQTSLSLSLSLVQPIPAYALSPQRALMDNSYSKLLMNYCNILDLCQQLFVGGTEQFVPRACSNGSLDLDVYILALSCDIVAQKDANNDTELEQKRSLFNLQIQFNFMVHFD